MTNTPTQWPDDPATIEDPTAFQDWPDDPAFEDPAYLAWCEAQDARGELAGAPDTIGCYECGGFDGVTAPERAVVKLGPIAEAHRDPTQTYVLACGHTAI